MSIEAQLDRYLTGVEYAEQLFESVCEWVLADLHKDYFEDPEATELRRLVYDGTASVEDCKLWSDAEEAYIDSLSPY